MHTDNQCALIYKDSKVLFHNTHTHSLMHFYMSCQRLWIAQVVCMHRSWSVVARAFPANAPRHLQLRPLGHRSWRSMRGPRRRWKWPSWKYHMWMHSSSLFGSWLIVVTLFAGFHVISAYSVDIGYSSWCSSWPADGTRPSTPHKKRTETKDVKAGVWKTLKNEDVGERWEKIVLAWYLYAEMFEKRSSTNIGVDSSHRLWGAIVWNGRVAELQKELKRNEKRETRRGFGLRLRCRVSTQHKWKLQIPWVQGTAPNFALIFHFRFEVAITWQRHICMQTTRSGPGPWS